MLRAATRAAHDRVDALFAAFDLASRVDYGRFLAVQAAACLPVEDALARGGAEVLLPGWTASRRSPLRMADLAELDLPVPAPIAFRDFASTAALAGGAYVLEGSRLGGAMLARAVPAALPRRFLAAGTRPWKLLIARLDQLLASDAERRVAISSARDVFALFARAANLSTQAA
jgi:heme oxygenase